MNKSANEDHAVEQLRAHRQSFHQGQAAGVKARLASKNPLVALALLHESMKTSSATYAAMADELGEIVRST